MKIIGITGGVGSGKSEVLKYLENSCGAVVCQADLVAKNLQKRGTICFREMVAHFGPEILGVDGRLDRKKLAEIVFKDSKELAALNAIVHPAVKQSIFRKIRREEKKGSTLFVLEAALLLEEHYEEICDEVWYIDTNVEVRKERLKRSRGYSDEKIDDMIRAQKSREEFLSKCDRNIDNSRSFDETKEQIDQMLTALETEKTH